MNELEFLDDQLRVTSARSHDGVRHFSARLASDGGCCPDCGQSCHRRHSFATPDRISARNETTAGRKGSKHAPPRDESEYDRSDAELELEDRQKIQCPGLRTLLTETTKTSLNRLFHVTFEGMCPKSVHIPVNGCLSEAIRLQRFVWRGPSPFT